MRDINDLTEEILEFSDLDILAIYGLITQKTDFRFTHEQWKKIKEGNLEKDISYQVLDLANEVIQRNYDDIRFIFLRVKFEKGLIHPNTLPEGSIKDPFFVSMSNGIITGNVFHSRRQCDACKPHDKHSVIVEVERSTVENSMFLCPICERKERILRKQKLDDERAIRKISK